MTKPAAPTDFHDPTWARDASGNVLTGLLIDRRGIWHWTEVRVRLSEEMSVAVRNASRQGRLPREARREGDQHLLVRIFTDRRPSSADAALNLEVQRGLARLKQRLVR